MANIAGSFRLSVGDRVSNGSAGFPLPGGVRANATYLGGSPQVWKNQGWNGAALETWTSIGEPNTFPPSGNFLTYLQHQLVKE